MKHFLILLVGISALTITSCSTAAAEKIADEFHQKLDAGDTDYIVKNLADTEDLSEDVWTDFLDLVISWGPQTDRTKTSGFSTKINNGVTTIKLGYTFNVIGYGLIHERLVLRDKGDGYKIITALMNSDEAVVENGTAGY